MKFFFLILKLIIVLSIILYPTASNSNATGSPGGKTGSPNDSQSCAGCHYAGIGNEAMITTNIPSSGYTPNQTYTITATVNQTGITKFGFEITSEENTGNAKIGSFLITNSTEMQLTNSNTAITHKAAGVSGNNSKSWSMDWIAPISGTGDITFYGAFIAGNGNGNNNGDTYHSTNLTITEDITSHTNNLSLKDDFTFNSTNKTIEAINTILIYDITGKLVLSSNKDIISISNLTSGAYVIKSKNKTQKILIY